jgi:hypothetical protein
MYDGEAAKQWSLEPGFLADGSPLRSASTSLYRRLHCGYEKMKSRCVEEDGREKGEGCPSESSPGKEDKCGESNLAKAKIRSMSEIELALAKPIEVSKKFCFPDTPSSSQGRHDESGPVVQAASRLEAHVISFAKLGDSSPDTPEALPLGKTATTDVLPPPMATHGWYSYYSLASLFCDLAVFLVMLPADDGAHLRPSGGMDEDLVQ